MVDRAWLGESRSVRGSRARLRRTQLAGAHGYRDSGAADRGDNRNCSGASWGPLTSHPRRGPPWRGLRLRSHPVWQLAGADVPGEELRQRVALRIGQI